MNAGLRKGIVVAIGIIINVIGRCFATEFEWPLWFDMVGTIVVTYFVGIWGGLITSLLSNLLMGILDLTALMYPVTSIAAVVITYVFVKKGYMNAVFKAIVCGFWLGLACTVVSTPVNLIFYDGYSNNIWGDTLVDMLKWFEVSAVLSAFAGELVVEIVDKQACVVAACCIIYTVKSIKNKKAMPFKFLAFVLALISAGALYGQASEVKAADSFVKTIYDNANGMVSSEANVICETEDGYMWIGSYAGLTKYDGQEFEFIREGGLVNVVGMMTDSKGRLWIGTNDAGVARYEDGSYTYFTREDGLASNSIRCFAEDKEGNVYVGTSDKICRFSPDDKIEILETGLTFVKAMTVYNGILVTMDNNGDIHAVGENGVMTLDDSRNRFYQCLANTSRGVIVGTGDGKVFILEVTKDNLSIKTQLEVPAKEISALFEDRQKRIWIATELGFGYINEDNIYKKMNYEGFDAWIVDFHEDYQGNLWIASSSHGVMKLSESPFINLFESTGIEKDIVNAIEYYNGDYYCGTDRKLIVFDGTTMEQKTNSLTKAIDGCRVRSIYRDSQDRLWLCTYSGLFCYIPEEGIRVYTQKTDSVTSDRFRCITELKDGTLVAGTADGINIIKDGYVTGTLTGEEGLANTQILSVVEGKDGNAWAGSDGSGIYVIADGKLIKNYTVEDGLSSNVILRIVPHEDGYLIVTSNALCHMDLEGNIEKLTNFPYFNNFDVVIDGETAYVTCSAGVYKTELKVLCENEAGPFRLFAAGEGLFSGLTANSWNYITEEGILYLCSNNGAIVFNSDNTNAQENMKYGIVSILCDGKEIAVSDGKFVVPINTESLSIYASVRNYAFTDVKVRFYVKEIDNNPVVYAWNEIEPIRIFKPELSEYNICLQILDSTGETVLKEDVYTISRDMQPWEEPAYKKYLLFVGAEIILLTIVSLAAIALFINRKNELERQQITLEKKVDEQTAKTKKLFIQTVTALSEAVDAKDRYTSGHSKRVANYSRMIAARMGKSKEEQEEIYRAGLLHDVGKIRIPVEIINKPGKLTDEEYNIIKLHPITGYHILRGISDGSFIAIAAKYHHERYDGKGYPNGLSGENIPEAARILGVADSYDAMTSNRSYRGALRQDIVRDEIEKGKGTQFDPHIADIMLQLIDEDKEYIMKQIDTFNRRILVIDDELMNHKVIEHIMKDEPMYCINSAFSGREALEILENQFFDLILLDLKMPEMDGIETLKLIRQKCRTPVALMTGDKTLDAYAEIAELGCDDYITKPVMPLLVKEIVHNLTERTNINN